MMPAPPLAARPWASSLGGASQQECAQGVLCTNLACPFQHPLGEAPQPSAGAERGGTAVVPSLALSTSLPYFHGSPIKAWGSILRTGLRSLSGTVHQDHGAAMGAGIYLAEHPGTSMPYSNGGVRRGGGAGAVEHVGVARYLPLLHCS